MIIGERVEQAKNELTKLTGLKPVTVTGAFKEDHGWVIQIEVLEMSRIPNSTDMLGEYRVRLDDDGTLLTFERKRSRLRGQIIEEEERE